MHSPSVFLLRKNPAPSQREPRLYKFNIPANYNLNIIYSAQSVGVTYNLKNEKKKSTFHLEGAFHYGIDLIK